MLKEFEVVSSPNMKNIICKAKESSFLDVLEIKHRSIYDYIQSSIFPRQGIDEPCHVFKMSIHGHASRVEYMRRMSKGDLMQC